MEKAGAKQKKPPRKTDKQQFERFVETARKLGVNDSMEDFQVKFRKIVSSKQRQSGKHEGVPKK